MSEELLSHFTEQERAAIRELGEIQDLSPLQVLRCGLRDYQIRVKGCPDFGPKAPLVAPASVVPQGKSATPRTDAACNKSDSVISTTDNLMYLACELERELASSREREAEAQAFTESARKEWADMAIQLRAQLEQAQAALASHAK